MALSVTGETRDIENKTVQSQKDQLSNQILSWNREVQVYRVHVQPEVNVMLVMRYYPTDGRG
jgi:hypothetical protein